MTLREKHNYNKEVMKLFTVKCFLYTTSSTLK